MIDSLTTTQAEEAGPLGDGVYRGMAGYTQWREDPDKVRLLRDALALLDVADHLTADS